MHVHACMPMTTDTNIGHRLPNKADVNSQLDHNTSLNYIHTYTQPNLPSYTLLQLYSFTGETATDHTA